VQLAYAAKSNGVDEIYLTKCDHLRDFFRTKKQTIPIVAKYLLNGEEIDFVPSPAAVYKEVKTEEVQLTAFDEIVTSPTALPVAIKELCRMVETACHCRVRGIGVGPERDQMILV
jgi:adenylosuccinate synthase